VSLIYVTQENHSSTIVELGNRRRRVISLTPRLHDPPENNLLNLLDTKINCIILLSVSSYSVILMIYTIHELISEMKSRILQMVAK
jgi:hypothetical protein